MTAAAEGAGVTATTKGAGVTAAAEGAGVTAAAEGAGVTAARVGARVGGDEVQTLAPEVTEFVPAGHFWQLNAPLVFPKYPGGQSAQKPGEEA